MRRKPRPGETAPAQTGTPLSEWAAKVNQRKYVTRGELLSVVNAALNAYREQHTFRGRLARWLRERKAEQVAGGERAA